jgi:hypothetical protein
LPQLVFFDEVAQVSPTVLDALRYRRGGNVEGELGFLVYIQRH